MPANTERLTSAVASIEITSFGANTDLASQIPTGLTDKMGGPARRIRINTVGTSPTLAIQYGNGCTDTLKNLNAGDVFDVQVAKILATGTSGVTSITVFW